MSKDSYLDPSELLTLPAVTLGELADSLESGSLRHGISTGLVAPFAGSNARLVASVLRAFQEEGSSSRALASLCRCLAHVKGAIEKSANDVYLTLSGPHLEGIPVVSTPTVVRALFEEAQGDVLLASYVFHDARELLAPLVERCSSDPTFRVRFIVDLSHQRKGATEPLPLIANRFLADFRERCWGESKLPEFWHDPRVFDALHRRDAGVMHAKCVVIDNSAALITSANFTAAAQERNIEVGVVLRNAHQVQRLRMYFERLMAAGLLHRVG